MNMHENFEMLTSNNTVALLIDHQAGLMLFPGDIDPMRLRMNSIALAKVLKSHNIPTILTAAAGGPSGSLGPIIPEITDLFPEVDVIYRTKTNSWHDQEIHDAIVRTGRKKLIVAGITADFCAGLPAKSAAADGYDVRLIMDASGNIDNLVTWAAIANLTQYGVKCSNWLSVACELLADWNRPKEAQELQEIYYEHLPNWSMLELIQQHRPALTPA